MKTIYYELYHEYENDDDDYKYIGAFSSAKKAKEVIEQLIRQPGFSDYPKKAFSIHKCRINTYEWKEGFRSWKDQ